MIKKLVISLLLCIPLCFSASAEENGPEYFQEYDDYHEFEQDYIDSVVVDKIDRQKKFLKPNVPALIIGAALGSGSVYIVLRNKLSPPKPDPYFRKPDAKHEITDKKDNFER